MTQALEKQKGPYKIYTQNSTKHAGQRYVTYIENIFWFFFGFFHFYFRFLKMISPRNVELSPWYGQ